MNKTREVEEVLPPFGDLTARNPWTFWFKQTAAIGSRLNRFCPRRQAFSTLSSLKDINSSLVLSSWFRHPTTTNSRSSVNLSPAQLFLSFSDSDIQTEQVKRLYHGNETVKSVWFFVVLSEEHSQFSRWRIKKRYKTKTEFRNFANCLAVDCLHRWGVHPDSDLQWQCDQVINLQRQLLICDYMSDSLRCDNVEKRSTLCKSSATVTTDGNRDIDVYMIGLDYYFCWMQQSSTNA